jgi:hypothetical protein
VLERPSITVTVTVTGKAAQGQCGRPLSNDRGLGKRRSVMGQLPETASVVGVWRSGR